MGDDRFVVSAGNDQISVAGDAVSGFDTSSSIAVRTLTESSDAWSELDASLVLRALVVLCEGCRRIRRYNFSAQRELKSCMRRLLHQPPISVLNSNWLQQVCRPTKKITLSDLSTKLSDAEGSVNASLDALNQQINPAVTLAESAQGSQGRVCFEAQRLSDSFSSQLLKRPLEQPLQRAKPSLQRR